MIEYILFWIFCIIALLFFLYYLFVIRFFSPYPTLDEDIRNSHVNTVDDALDDWLCKRGARKTMVYLKNAKQWRDNYYKRLINTSSLLGRLRFREYIRITARGKVNAFTFRLIHYEREFIRDGNTVKEVKTEKEIDKQTYSEYEMRKRIKEIHYSKGDGLFNFVNHSKRRGKHHSKRRH